jgi:predicted nucleic acid-binding protein
VVTVYVDASAIIACLVPESYSRAAQKAVSAEPAVPWTAILDLEVRTSLRRMVGAHRLTASELAVVLTHLEADVEAGRLLELPVDLYAMFARAEVLSGRHASGCLAGSLDILQVATALELGCRRFVTLDSRQARLARACGMEVADLSKTRIRSRRR